MNSFKRSERHVTQPTRMDRVGRSFVEEPVGFEVEVREAFSLFDPNHTGEITYHELKVILRALGFDIKRSEVVQLARQFDVHETGKVNYEHYLEIMREKYSSRDVIEQALKAFQLFDVDGKGRISLSDLKRVARELGESLREDEIATMIEEFDHDGDGFINEEEFLAIVRPSLL